MKEGDFGSMCRRSVGGADDVVVSTKETVDPGVLSLASNIEEVVDRAVEASIAILSTAAKGFARIIGGLVGVEKQVVGNMSTVSVKGVDPRAKVAVLSAVNKAEDSSLSVGSASQQGNLRSIASSREALGVVGVSSDIIDDGSEPRVEGRVEVGSLEVVDVDVTKTLELAIALGATDLFGNSIEGLVDGSISRSRDGIGAHLDSTLEEGVGVVPEVVVDLDGAGGMTTKDDVVRVTTEGFVMSAKVFIQASA